MLYTVAPSRPKGGVRDFTSTGFAVTGGVRLRVLIAEDDTGQGLILKSIVTMLGHEGHLVDDGMAAVFSAAELRPDVILMDIGMPRLDGYEATRRIRALAGYPTIVALSVWNREADLKLSAAAGMNHHLVKPLDLHALLAILQHAQANKSP
jgi:CheY-like chemotaxis protein